MQTLQLNAFGNADDVVELLSPPDPEPGTGQVVVRMEAATINASDFLLINGTYGVRPALPYGVGGEGVGRVTALGAGVDPGLEGRRVLLLPTYDHGTWATHALVAHDAVVPVPDDADPLQLAMIGINPMTALLLLRDYGAQEGGPDRLVGQNAANSAVGEYVVRLARLSGLQTLNVGRREAAAEQVRSWGGDVVVVDGEDLRGDLKSALDGRELSVVIDGVGGKTPTTMANGLGFRGTVVTYGLQGGRPPALTVRDLIFFEKRVAGFWLGNWLRTTPRPEVHERYAELVRHVAAGELTARVDRTYPLEDWREAFARAQAHEREGKILFAFPTG